MLITRSPALTVQRLGIGSPRQNLRATRVVPPIPSRFAIGTIDAQVHGRFPLYCNGTGFPERIWEAPGATATIYGLPLFPQIPSRPNLNNRFGSIAAIQQDGCEI